MTWPPASPKSLRVAALLVFLVGLPPSAGAQDKCSKLTAEFQTAEAAREGSIKRLRQSHGTRLAGFKKSGDTKAAEAECKEFAARQQSMLTALERANSAIARRADEACGGTAMQTRNTGAFTALQDAASRYGQECLDVVHGKAAAPPPAAAVATPAPAAASPLKATTPGAAPAKAAAATTVQPLPAPATEPAGTPRTAILPSGKPIPQETLTVPSKEEKPANTDPGCAAGITDFESGQFAAAATKIAAIPAKNRDAQCAAAYAEALEKNGDASAALAAVAPGLAAAEAAKDKYAIAQLYKVRARIQESKDQFAEAAESYDLAVRANPSDSPGALRMWENFRRAGDNAKGAFQFELYLSQQGRDPRIFGPMIEEAFVINIDEVLANFMVRIASTNEDDLTIGNLYYNAALILARKINGERAVKCLNYLNLAETSFKKGLKSDHQIFKMIAHYRAQITKFAPAP